LVEDSWVLKKLWKFISGLSKLTLMTLTPITKVDIDGINPIKSHDNEKIVSGVPIKYPCFIV